MIDGKRITIVVPCRNEEKNITEFIQKIPSYIDEILVVDNNSNDRTAEFAKRAGVKVIIEKRALGGIGYGFAHMTGILHATGDYIIAMDGDDTYPVRSIARIVRMMEKKGLDFVSCNRLPLTNPKAISRIRQLGIKILNLEVFLLYFVPVNDILTGMWITKRKVARRLTLDAGDWNFSPEIKLAAMSAPDIRFAEYHIDHFERMHEPSKQQIFKTGFHHAWYILNRRITTDNPIPKIIYEWITILKRQAFLPMVTQR